jgi:hypothetical protein
MFIETAAHPHHNGQDSKHNRDAANPDHSDSVACKTSIRNFEA